MSLSVHYLAPAFVDAERLSPSAVRRKRFAGWQWHRLCPGFGTAGGASSYSRALVAPDGTIALVSDRADGPAADALPALVVDYRLVKLAVPFADKAEAKARGATWVGHLRTWACSPTDADCFKQWVSGEPEVFNLLAE